MPDETNNETSEPRDENAEAPEGRDGQAAADTPEAPQASAEDDSTAEEPNPEGEAPAGEPAAEAVPAAEEAPAKETPSEETPPAAEEAPAEETPSEETPPAAEEAAPAGEETPAQPARKTEPAAQKKDVIPGADLEPIAVEPTGPALSAEEKARLEAEEEEKARREAARLAAEESSDAASRAPAKMESGSRFLATGKRKCSIARVTLLPGDGKIEINKRSLEEFFPRPLHQTMAVQPLTVSGYEGNVDVRVRVHGGGISGQAGAVRHGIARALTEIDSELRADLKRRGFLTRDARVKERRKAGFKKARKKPQFSKR
jgi:small subunit ribosomal protein S9